MLRKVETLVVLNQYKKNIRSNRGYLTDLGLVPLANPQEAITQVKQT